MSDDILTDEQIDALAWLRVDHWKALQAHGIAANAEIARLREKINEQERFAVRREASHHADVARLRAELAEKERVLWDVPLYTLDERVVEPWKKRRAALASGGEQGQGAEEPQAVGGGESDLHGGESVEGRPESEPMAPASAPDSPVCRWTHVAADNRYPWRTGCGYNTTASPGRWKNKCPFPDCGLPIVTDGEEG